MICKIESDLDCLKYFKNIHKTYYNNYINKDF